VQWMSRYDPKRTRAENAQFVLDKIIKLGFSIGAGSRIMRMHQVLTAGPKIVPRDDPEFETALEAERDMQMLGFIIDVLNDQLLRDDYRERFQTVMRDSVLPQQDMQSSFGRDAQFEFYIAAVCEKAGMTPVQFEEPDVTCHVGSVKFGIAAKRIKNHSNLKDRVRKAAEQIQHSQLPGFIAIDTSVALNRENERISVPMLDEIFMRIHKKALNEFIRHYHDDIQRWVRAKGVRGIILHDQQVRYLEGDAWCTSGMTLWLETIRFNARMSKEYAIFEQKYKLGIPNVEDV
jgi:hypothetical protein